MSETGEETSGRPTPAGRARRLAKRALPVLLLLAQIFWVHQELVSNRKVRPLRVPDTESYVVLSRKDTVEGALTHYRTFGYPLLLKIFGWRELPGRELWMFFGAVICFFAGVTAYASSGWLGLAAASPLLYGDTLKLFGRIQPDFVSCAYVLAAVGALLLLMSRPRNGALWALLALTMLLAYQSRPATLFIIGWLPVMGWALRTLRERRMSRAAVVWATAVAAVGLLPYLAFMSWRYARVGDFGLVSFGGYNMSGLAASLVDEEMLDELEGENKKIATAIYGRRTRKGWAPYDPAAGSDEWFQQYSDNIWKISAPVATIRARAERAAAPPGSPHRYQRLVVNDKLATFSKDVIRRRLSKYVRWVLDANLFGWRQLGGSPWVVWPAAALAASWLGLWAGRRRGYRSRAGWTSRDGRIAGLLLLGTSYFLGYVLLISLLSFPFDRYYYGTVLLLPSVLCVALAAAWGAILGGLRERFAARTI
jgi:hypothetical protein